MEETEMENNNEIEAFLAEIETEQQANKGERTYISRDTLRALLKELRVNMAFQPQ